MRFKNKKFTIATLILFASGSILLMSVDKKKFSHKIHIKEGVECEDCHTSVTESEVQSDNNFPTSNDACSDCHEDVFIQNVIYQKPAAQGILVFNHKKHISKQRLKCIKCHGAIKQTRYVEGSGYPSMKSCRNCHKRRKATLVCKDCHKSKLQFPHITHKEDAECEDCHADITKSTTTLTSADIPSTSPCEDCHDTSAEADTVNFSYYTPLYKMNHKLHVVDEKLECSTCHLAIGKSNFFKQEDNLMKMEDCFKCHDNKKASQRCDICHTDKRMPESHIGNWTQLHKLKSASNKKECMSCHSMEAFCIDCHKDTYKPLDTHNPNFELTHKFESRIAMRNCKACHDQTFCSDCHQSKGVSPRSSTLLFSPHPIDWIDPRSRNFHAKRGRMRLSSCKTCHIPTDCNFCHFKETRGRR